MMRLSFLISCLAALACAMTVDTTTDIPGERPYPTQLLELTPIEPNHSDLRGLPAVDRDPLKWQNRWHDNYH